MRLSRAIGVLAVMMCCGVWPSAAYSADTPLRVDTHVEPTSGTVGDKFRLSVAATAPSAGRLEVLPLFDLQSSWTVIGTPETLTRSENGQQINTYNYSIVPFETGAFSVPQVAVTYNAADGTSITERSKPLQVTINSVLSGDGSASTLRDVKPPVALAVPKALAWSIILLGVLLIAALAWFIWNRYSHRLKRMLGQGLTPPELALKKISQLESDRLIEQKKMKEFYTRLTDALRVYLHQAFGVQAMDLTSNELLDAMDRKAEDQSPAHVEEYRRAMARLVDVLNEADMVKFARFIPEPSQCRRAMQASRDVISFTRYRFNAPEEEEAKHGSQKGRRGRGGRPGTGPMTSPAKPVPSAATTSPNAPGSQTGVSQ